MLDCNKKRISKNYEAKKKKKILFYLSDNFVKSYRKPSREIKLLQGATKDWNWYKDANQAIAINNEKMGDFISFCAKVSWIYVKMISLY